MTQIISHQALENFAAAILQRGGFTENEARVTARSLVLANLAGHDTHGVIRVLEYIDALSKAEVKSGVSFSVLNETASSLTANAHAGLGQVLMPQFLDRLIDKAREAGTASGALRHCGHVGRLGEWAEYIAARGLAGFVAVNDNGVLRCVAPPGGKDACTSTNPIAFGIPAGDGQPYILDMSTSATSFGAMRLAYMEGEECGEYEAQDSEGVMTRDPAKLFEEPKGALLPMGGPQGYKGFGLSMVVDLLTAGLSGGFTPPAPEGEAMLNNVLVVLWDPVQFSGMAHLEEQARKYIAHVKSSTPIDPDQPVRIAGERAAVEKAKRMAEGIPLGDKTYEALVDKARELGVEPPI